MQFAWPFNSPVDLDKYPDYIKYVPQPMDLGTMKDKAEGGAYKEPGQVYSDFHLVFANAKAYNPPGSDVYYMATLLQVRGGGVELEVGC